MAPFPVRAPAKTNRKQSVNTQNTFVCSVGFSNTWERPHISYANTKKVHSKVVLAFTYTKQELPISLTHTNAHSASFYTSNSQNASNNKPLRRPIQSSRNARLFDKQHLLPEGTLAFHFSQMECNKILHVGYTRCSRRMSVSIRWTISLVGSFCGDRTEL